MDLPTHAAFGLAIGLVFFGRPEVAVLVMIGAILPDIDRDWLAKANAIGEEQRHRAILHNVFIVSIAFLVRPFLAVGVFIHMLQDSFTTDDDKGCEWFYPLSRWVKRGKFDAKKANAQDSRSNSLKININLILGQGSALKLRLVVKAIEHILSS
jgi:membrane-bound metal-dependent hydrolase YbcI (DUF457 family)